MADFLIEADITAEKVEAGGRAAVNIADRMTQAFEKSLKVIEMLEARIGSLSKLSKIKMEVGVGADQIRTQREFLKIQSEQLRNEKAFQQARKARISADREELALNRDKQSFDNAELRHEKQMAQTRRANLQLEREQLRLNRERNQLNNPQLHAQLQLDKLKQSQLKTEREQLRLTQQQENLDAQRARRADQSAKKAAQKSPSAFGGIGSQLSGFGGALQGYGSALSLGLTAPIVLAGRALFSLGADLDASRNKLIAATGSVEAANAKLKEMRVLASQNAGVFSDFAVEAYTALKPIEGITEQTINSLIKSFGRLKLANPELDITKFRQNLTQLYNQDFERTDLKEAVGAFPRMGEILEKQFGLKGNDLESLGAGLKALRKSGKLTMEEFLAGFAEGVQNDKNLSLLTDSVGIRMQKLKERIFISLEPIGEKVAEMLEKGGKFIAPYVDKIGEAFQKLDPWTQKFLIFFAGAVAVVGPFLGVLGTLVAGIVSLGSTLAAVFTSPITLGIAAFLLELGVAAATLYLAWKNNFAGIQQTVERLGNGVKTAWDAIYSIISTVGGQIIGFVRNNWGLISATIETASNILKASHTATLDFIYAAWENFIKPTINLVGYFASEIVTRILDLTKLVMQIFTGDWSGAWKTFLKILEDTVRQFTQLTKKFYEIIWTVIGEIIKFGIANGPKMFAWMGIAAGKAVVAVLYFFYTLPAKIAEYVPKVASAAWDIGKAIIRGIASGMSGSEQQFGEQLQNAATFDDFLKDFQGKFKDLFNFSELEAKKLESVFDKPTDGAKKFAGALDNVGEKVKKVGALSGVLDAMRMGTMGQESGGDSRIKNGRTGATGLFQVMPENIPDWTSKTPGVGRMSVEEFRSSPTAQIAVFNKYMGEYLQIAKRKSGGDEEKTVRMAAAAWYGGEKRMYRYNDFRRFRADEPSFGEYTSSVYKRYQTAKNGKNFRADEEDIKKNISAEVTQAENDRVTRALIDAANTTRMMPEADVIRDYNRLLVRDAEKNRAKQPTLEDTEALFKNYGTFSKPQDSIIREQTLRETDPRGARFLETSKSLGLTADPGEQTRAEKLAERRLYIEDEILIKQEDYRQSLEETITDQEVEYRLLSQRNLQLEAAVAYTREQNEQYRALQNLQIELDVLQRQAADETFTSERRLLAARREEIDLRREIVQLEDRLANSGVNDSLKVQAAYLSDILDLRERELDAVISINRSQLEIAESMTVSNNQIRANVLDHLASQKTLNEAFADDFIDTYEKVAGSLDKVFDKMKFGANVAKTLFRGALTEVAKVGLDFLFPGSGLGDKLKSTGNPVVDGITKSNDYLKKIVDNTSPGTTLGNISISGGSAGGGGQTGGGLGGVLGGILRLFGLGGKTGAGTASTPPYFPAGMIGGAIGGGSSALALIPDLLANAAGGNSLNPVSITDDGVRKVVMGSGATYASGSNKTGLLGGLGSLFGKGGLLKSLSAMVPGLGMSLGGNLGGSSALGSILGSAGGLLGGGLMGALLGGSLTGATTGGIFAGGGLLGLSAIGGVTLAAAPLLMLGAWLLGRNAKRRQEETVRNSAMLDAFGQLDDLIKQVSNDKVDGQSALASANGLRADYLTKMGQLTDKKTRNIALKDVSRIDQKTVTLQQAVAAQEARQTTAKQFTGEFATGGHIFADGGTYHANYAAAGGYSGMVPRGFSGRIPGAFDRKDDLLMAVSRGEHAIVLNPAQYSRIGDRLDPLLREAQVPRFEQGGQYAPPVTAASGPKNNNSESSGSMNHPVTVVIESLDIEIETEIDAEGIFVKGAKTRGGQRATINTINVYGKSKGRMPG